MFNITKFIEVLITYRNGKKNSAKDQGRKERGLTLRQLAEKVGCTPSYVSQLEKGLTVPSLSMVGRLAAALSITVVDLLSEVSDGEQGDWHLHKADRKTIDYPDAKVSSLPLFSQTIAYGMYPRK